MSKCVAALSIILYESSSLSYVRRSCRYLIARQLLRYDGIRGFLIALFPSDSTSGEDASLEKMESAAKALQILPARMDALVSANARLLVLHIDGSYRNIFPSSYPSYCLCYRLKGMPRLHINAALHSSFPVFFHRKAMSIMWSSLGFCCLHFISPSYKLQTNTPTKSNSLLPLRYLFPLKCHPQRPW